MDEQNNPYSASAQGLGYIYQPRFALFKLFQWPEESAILIEKDDDIDFIDKDGVKSLASLKHKKRGDRLSDLSVDFWKSVNIWFERYCNDGKQQSSLRFLLFTTSTVSENSILGHFLNEGLEFSKTLLNEIILTISKSESKIIKPVSKKIEKLNDEEKQDFFSRILIFDNSPRITDLPKIIIQQHMRTVRSEFRVPIFFFF